MTTMNLKSMAAALLMTAPFIISKIHAIEAFPNETTAEKKSAAGRLTEKYKSVEEIIKALGDSISCWAWKNNKLNPVVLNKKKSSKYKNYICYDAVPHKEYFTSIFQAKERVLLGVGLEEDEGLAALYPDIVARGIYKYWYMPARHHGDGKSSQKIKLIERDLRSINLSERIEWSDAVYPTLFDAVLALDNFYSKVGRLTEKYKSVEEIIKALGDSISCWTWKNNKLNPVVLNKKESSKYKNYICYDAVTHEKYFTSIFQAKERVLLGVGLEEDEGLAALYPDIVARGIYKYWYMPARCHGDSKSNQKIKLIERDLRSINLSERIEWSDAVYPTLFDAVLALDNFYSNYLTHVIIRSR